MPIIVLNGNPQEQQAEPYTSLLESAGFELRWVDSDRFSEGGTTDDEVIELLQGASAVIARATQFPAAVLDAMPNLRVVARAGVGFDKVDVAAATANDVVVTITPNSNYEAVAEHALSLIFALAKTLVSGDKTVRAGKWSRMPRRPLRDSTLGIVGLGRIGKSLALRALAMKMHVVATEQLPDESFVEKHDIELVDLDNLLETADFVSLHCPLTDETRGMINSERLALMKPTAALVNTACGGLVVESDLADALESGGIASAGLDVFEQEPAARGNRLFELDNVIVSPHVAGLDDLSTKAMRTEAANCIISLSKSEWPDGAVVNDELIGRWRW